MKFIIQIISAIFILQSCNPKAPTIKIVNIDNLSENEGFIDIPFTIVQQNVENGYLKNKIQAISENDTLELLISLKEGIPPGFVNGVPQNMFVNEGIIFESTGERSNLLFKKLSKKYGVQADNLKIKDKQIFTCANLNQEPINYKSGTPKFKIFMEDEMENAELFVNFDFKNATISFSEKDPEYRVALINLMKQL
ncbi:MAG: hypothetical protein IPM42_15360 [Saprospiraceae bacterium]|nr:hypothetical protein [Saprospiraceae bacterium]